MLLLLVHKIFTFYINGVLNCKYPAPGPKFKGPSHYRLTVSKTSFGETRCCWETSGEITFTPNFMQSNTRFLSLRVCDGRTDGRQTWSPRKSIFCFIWHFDVGVPAALSVAMTVTASTQLRADLMDGGQFRPYTWVFIRAGYKNVKKIQKLKTLKLETKTDMKPLL